MPRIAFSLDGHPFVELHQLLKLAGLVDSGGRRQARGGQRRRQRRRRGGAAQEREDPRGAKRFASSKPKSSSKTEPTTLHSVAAAPFESKGARGSAGMWHAA
jgi:hypothetical protein